MPRACNAKERNHGGVSLPWFPLLLTGAMALIHYIGAAASELLIFDRAKIMDGELWRLVTGHLVHLNFQHLIWNALAYLILAVMARHDEGISYSRQAGIIAAGIVAIDAAIFLSPTQLSYYAGFSGVLNALWAVMIVEAWWQKRSGFIALIGLLSLMKIAYEAVTAETLFFYTPWPAAFEGHAGGALAGLLFLAAERLLPRLRDRRRPGRPPLKLP